MDCIMTLLQLRPPTAESEAEELDAARWLRIEETDSVEYSCQTKDIDCDATCFVTFEGTKILVRFDTAHNQMREIHNLLQANIVGYPSWGDMKYTSVNGIDLRHGWLNEEPRVLRTGDTIVATNFTESRDGNPSTIAVDPSVFAFSVLQTP